MYRRESDRERVTQRENERERVRGGGAKASFIFTSYTQEYSLMAKQPQYRVAILSVQLESYTISV